jgi:GTPase SAR1 family protein
MVHSSPKTGRDICSITWPRNEYDDSQCIHSTRDVANLCFLQLSIPRPLPLRVFVSSLGPGLLACMYALTCLRCCVLPSTTTEVVTTQPTIGSNVEEVVYKNTRYVFDSSKHLMLGPVLLRLCYASPVSGPFTHFLCISACLLMAPSCFQVGLQSLLACELRFECWDLGGQESLRHSWASYYAHAHAVVMVIDSTDRYVNLLVQNHRVLPLFLFVQRSRSCVQSDQYMHVLDGHLPANVCWHRHSHTCT